MMNSGHCGERGIGVGDMICTLYMPFVCVIALFFVLWTSGHQGGIIMLGLWQKRMKDTVDGLPIINKYDMPRTTYLFIPYEYMALRINPQPLYKTPGRPGRDKHQLCPYHQPTKPNPNHLTPGASTHHSTAATERLPSELERFRTLFRHSHPMLPVTVIVSMHGSGGAAPQDPPKMISSPVHKVRYRIESKTFGTNLSSDVM